MNTMIISLAASTGMTFGERSAYSLRMLVVGMLMVFSVLALLWAVLALSKKLFYCYIITQKSPRVNSKTNF
jgi:hypothetical protein